MRSSLMLCATLVVTSSCMPDEARPEPLAPPDIETVLVYESERVQIFTQPQMLFCRGDGARIDAHIEQLSTDLEIAPPTQFPVYVLKNGTGELISDWCTGGANPDVTGCFRPWIVVSQVRSVPHELNHAVFRTVNPHAGADSHFWEEAYASAWETRETQMYLAAIPGLQAQEDGHSAGHWVRWLLDAHGIATVRDFYASIEPDSDRADTDAAFADVFGASYEQMVTQYGSQAAPLYPGYGWCDDVDVIDVPLGETHVTLRADCEAPDTYALAYPAVEAMYVRRILRLAQRSDLRIEYSSDTGVLNRHPCFEEPVASEDDPRLSGDASFWNIGSGVPAMGPLSTMDNIEPGDNLFEFAFPTGGPVEVEAIIRAELPANGP